MVTIEPDPINHFLREIGDGTSALIEAGCFISAMSLLYIGIDSMAHLSRPTNAKKATQQDFKKWVDDYLHITGDTEITSLEWYAARCATLHTFTAESDNSKKGIVRQLVYASGLPKAITYFSQKPDQVMVDIPQFRQAFLNAVIKYFEEGNNDPIRKKLIESRAQKMFVQFSL